MRRYPYKTSEGTFVKQEKLGLKTERERALNLFSFTAGKFIVQRLGDEHLAIPDPLKDDSIRVYYKKKKSGSYSEKDYFPWERKFLDKMVDCKYVRKNQGKIIMDLDFFQFAELIDIKPKAGSEFIHSMSEPFSEEDIEDRVMHNWLDHFKMNFHQVHASGHMSKEQLVEMVKEIQPKRAFPVHTENQQLFKTLCSNMQTIEQEKEYVLEN